MIVQPWFLATTFYFLNLFIAITISYVSLVGMNRKLLKLSLSIKLMPNFPFPFHVNAYVWIRRQLNKFILRILSVDISNVVHNHCFQNFYPICFVSDPIYFVTFSHIAIIRNFEWCTNFKWGFLKAFHFFIIFLSAGLWESTPLLNDNSPKTHYTFEKYQTIFLITMRMQKEN